MKLKFIIDKEYDLSCVKHRSMLKKIFDLLVLDYDKHLPELEISKKLYQKSWDKINDDFSKYVETETGYKWFYPGYECVVSVIHKGISNWGKAPKIVRIWKEDPYKMRRITAHELILSHYFEIYKRHYSNEGLKDDHVWVLAEIAAFALTSLTDEVKKFWPENTEYYTNHNYPHIVKMQNELKSAFLKRKSFDEYIKKGISLVKKYPNINSKGLNEGKIKMNNNLIIKAKNLFNQYQTLNDLRQSLDKKPYFSNYYHYDWLCQEMLNYAKEITKIKRFKDFNWEDFEIIVWMHNLGRYLESDSQGQGIKHASLGVKIFEDEFIKKNLINDEERIKKIKTCILYHSIPINEIKNSKIIHDNGTEEVFDYSELYPPKNYPELQILREGNFIGYLHTNKNFVKWDIKNAKKTINVKYELLKNLNPQPSKEAIIIANKWKKEYENYIKKVETIENKYDISIAEAINKLEVKKQFRLFKK